MAWFVDETINLDGTQKNGDSSFTKNCLNVICLDSKCRECPMCGMFNAKK